MNTAKGAEALLKELKQQAVSRPYIVRQLAKYCQGWPYVFGAAGEACTPGNRRKRAAIRPDHRAKIYGACPILSGKITSSGADAPPSLTSSGADAPPSPARGRQDGEGLCSACKWADTLIFDCRGFTRWLLLQAGIYIYGETVTTQWETASNWAAKGTDIKDMPRGLVCCVFRTGHTGMYTGDGWVRHCSTCVKEEQLPGTPNWQKWAVPAGLYATEELRKAGLNVDESKNILTLRRGSQGDETAELQVLLNAKYGANLEIDGIYGAKTEQAVKAFQSAHGLTADGVCGPKTRKALGLGAGDASDDGPMEGPVGDPAEWDDEEAADGVWIPRLKLMEIQAALSDSLNIISKALEVIPMQK